jgi:hypothetical protein
MKPPIAWTCKSRTEWWISPDPPERTRTAHCRLALAPAHTPTEASRDDAATDVVTRVVRSSAVTALNARAPATTMSTTATEATAPSTIHSRVRDGMPRTIGFGLAPGR